ncbi:MAG: diacylglycerol kinase family lipid kinase [Clostridiaceae bacterium]|jgi:YegS/Rv2252/BmrU family lipid kinase|nr:diacylglycerol kinase family lipid kinase [Clostridiaceae bacterium]
MEHLFIVNPAAGKGKTLRMVPEIENLMKKFSLPYRIEITQAPGHASEIAGHYIKTNDSIRIYSVGGDGTMNEILQPMVGTNASLGVIPAGTGNDFIKSFSMKKDPFKLLPLIVHSDPIPVDVCRFNNRYFLNIASIGFDADVVAMTGYLKKLPLIKGKVAYIGGILLAVIGLKKIEADFVVDGSEMHTKTMLLSAFANGRYYGGGMMPAPNAVPDDGLIDFCIINDVNRLKLLRFFPRLIKGTHTDMKEVSIKRCRSIEMKSSKPVHVNMDGELFRFSEAKIEILEKSLKFIKPL